MSGEKTGGSVDYYTAEVSADRTVDGRPGYTVQCLEVIETLGMTFAEGEAFKAIWRSCAARTLGKLKADNDAKYNAEKVVFYGGRMLKAARPGLPEGFVEFGHGLPGPTVGTIVDVLYVDNQVEEKKIVGQFSWNEVRAYKVRLATPPKMPSFDIPEALKPGAGKCFVQGCEFAALTGGACAKHSFPTATV